MTVPRTQPVAQHGQQTGRYLTEKKCSVTHFSQKSPRAHHVLAVGGWRLAVGDWRLVAVGGGWRRLVVGDWWLMAVGSGWQLAAGRRWRLAAVGGWRLAVGGGWRLALGSPLGRSLRAVLNKTKLVPSGPPWQQTPLGQHFRMQLPKVQPQRRPQLLVTSLAALFLFLIKRCPTTQAGHCPAAHVGLHAGTGRPLWHEAWPGQRLQS